MPACKPRLTRNFDKERTEVTKDGIGETGRNMSCSIWNNNAHARGRLDAGLHLGSGSVGGGCQMIGQDRIYLWMRDR